MRTKRRSVSETRKIELNLFFKTRLINNAVVDDDDDSVNDNNGDEKFELRRVNSTATSSTTSATKSDVGLRNRKNPNSTAASANTTDSLPSWTSRNPLLLFSAMPSQSLREAQENFSKGAHRLVCCVIVVVHTSLAVDIAVKIANLAAQIQALQMKIGES